MEPTELATLLQRRIAHLTQLRAAAAAVGDVPRVVDLDAEIAATQTQLDDLQQ